jgi:Asp-tRNA(Asn)/Glu-tRNA(Gln) amidotransferase C subunit
VTGATAKLETERAGSDREGGDAAHGVQGFAEIDEPMLRRLAALARLQIDTNEIPSLLRDLREITQYIADLELTPQDEGQNREGTPKETRDGALAHKESPLRADTVFGFEGREQALACGKLDDNAFSVPKVLE